ncbi:MAG: C40 family peptidase [Gammaproteobacteria bacterium]|nr:C40 family peptidase [Gammaproteobacteria bacterium]
MSPRFSRFLLLMPILGILAACGHAPVEHPPEAAGDRAVNLALTMIGKPYRYGGRTPAGFDCSGLVQYSYARAGVELPHGTDELRHATRLISRDHLQRGDLLFFTQNGRRSSHVALYIGDGRFVHAPSSGKKVYVAGFDDSYWQRHFTEARRPDID